MFSTKILRIKLFFQLSIYPYKKLYRLIIIFKIIINNNLPLKICYENIINITFFFSRRKLYGHTINLDKWYFFFFFWESRQVVPLERIYSHHKSREKTALNGNELEQKLWQFAMWFPHSYFWPYMNMIDRYIYLMWTSQQPSKHNIV